MPISKVLPLNALIFDTENETQVKNPNMDSDLSEGCEHNQLEKPKLEVHMFNHKKKKLSRALKSEKERQQQ